MRKQTKLVAVLSAAALLAIGASMTSFAATRGWVQEGEDWVYLDNSGERVYNQWKRSGSNYYWLGEDGLMVRDSLIYDDTANAYYYVDENGAKVMNGWKAVPNDEGVTFGESQVTPATLYYYFGSTGKATRSDGTINDVKVSKVAISGNKYFGFDTEGRMVSGWQQIPDSNKELQLYYFGTEDEGWAYTGWQLLEPDANVIAGEYDDQEWFYFESNGKAVKDKTKYIDGRYYAFDENGVMESDWYTLGTPPRIGTEGSSSAEIGVFGKSSSAIAYASSNGTMSSGWVYETAKDEDDLDQHWFYLVSVTDDSKVKRSVPYNYFAGTYAGETDGEVQVGPRAKVIKNKTYFFDTDGKMITGFVGIKNDAVYDAAVRRGDATLPTERPHGDITWAELEEGSQSSYAAKNGQVYDTFIGAEERYFNIPGRTLAPGLYYFLETDGYTSTDGQMQTGRTAITKDGETYYFYFDKTGSQATNTTDTYGKALINAVKDGYLYGPDGACITAEDGNAYAVYQLKEAVDVKGTKNITTDTLPAGTIVIINRTGRIKQNGSVTIDGIKYNVAKYRAEEKQDQ